MSLNPKANPPLSSRERVMLEFQRTSLALTLGFLESQQRVMMAYLTGTALYGSSDNAVSYPLLENQLSQQLSNLQNPTQFQNGYLTEQQQAAMQAQQQAAMQAQQQAAMQAQQQAALQAQQQASLQAQQQAALQAQQQASLQAQQQAALQAQQQAALQAQQQASLQAQQQAALQAQQQASATNRQQEIAQPTNGSQITTPSQQQSSTSNATSDATASTNPEELIAALIDIVSQRTGYPPEMLEPSLDLEADLGIDSIKRVEILNGFRKMLPDSSQLSLESGIEQLATVKTLQGIMDWIRTEFGANGTMTPQAEKTTTSEKAANSASLLDASSTTPKNGNSAEAPHTSGNGSNGSSKTKKDSNSTACGARLHSAKIEKASENATLFTITMSREEDRFMDDHLFDGVPVMPMAVAMELMLEAATTVYQACKVTEVKDLEILAGIVFESKSTDIHVLTETIEHTESSTTAKVSVQTSGKLRRTHFRATIVLTPNTVPLPSTGKQKGVASLPPNFRGVQILEPQSPSELPTAADIYQSYMFHGPLFQGITAVSTMGTNGIAGAVTPIQAAQLLANPGSSDWILNPTLLDSSMQLAGIWARQNMDVTVLPAGFKQLKIHGPLNGKNFNSLVMISPETKGLEIKCDLGIYSEDNELVLSIEGLKGIGSKALNRLSSRESEPVA
ncbi:MAG: polyketide synthase dehydratase domain-containing protein [Candidatus Obscuribacterales bacterium]|nr:polyketide synthase dehydratase domain-containing protein [Candidatus Obscuribacterales bacterium]